MNNILIAMKLAWNIIWLRNNSYVRTYVQGNHKYYVGFISKLEILWRQIWIPCVLFEYQEKCTKLIQMASYSCAIGTKWIEIAYLARRLFTFHFVCFECGGATYHAFWWMKPIFHSHGLCHALYIWIAAGVLYTHRVVCTFIVPTQIQPDTAYIDYDY